MSTTCRRILRWTLFILYLAALVYFLFFAETLGRTAGEAYRYNLTPFREIRRFWTNRDVIPFASYVNIIGNVAAFIPFGLLLPLAIWKTMGCAKTVALTFCFSLAVECVQLLTQVGSFDVDDLILNTLGGLLGWLLYRLIRWLYRRNLHGKNTVSAVHKKQ